jgi:hypothetical protein
MLNASNNDAREQRQELNNSSYAKHERPRRFSKYSRINVILSTHFCCKTRNPVDFKLIQQRLLKEDLKVLSSEIDPVEIRLIR